MNRLTDFFRRLRGAHPQRELLVRHKRERFWSIHNSETPPSALVPRRARYQALFFFIWALFMLLFGLHTLGKTIVPAFHSVAARERETKAWVQKLAAQPQGSETYKRNQLIAQQVMDLETQSARASWWTMMFAAALFAPMVIVFPLILIWIVPKNYHLLRRGSVGRAEVMSRNRWSSTAKLCFVTGAGKRIETI